MTSNNKVRESLSDMFAQFSHFQGNTSNDVGREAWNPFSQMRQTQLPRAPSPIDPKKITEFNSPEARKHLTDSCYTVIYHGSDQISIDSMRKDGMKTALKTGSSLDRRKQFEKGDAHELASEKSSTRHYASRHKEKIVAGLAGAAYFATLASKASGKPPELGRIFRESKEVNWKTDDDTDEMASDPDIAVYTEQDVPKGLILKRKGDNKEVTAASEAFRHKWNTSPLRESLKITVNLTPQQAVEELDGAITPVDDDKKLFL